MNARDRSPVQLPSGKSSRDQSGGVGAPPEIRYEERIVAFIDILGFKEAIRKSVNDEELRFRIYEALNIQLDGYAADFRKEVGLPEDHGFDERFHSFSDCIILSVKCDIHAIGLLVFSVFKICRAFLERGFTARGGIAKGKLYHSVNDRANVPDASPMVFGPAFIDAYMLESTHADSPRVIMQNAVWQDIRQHIQQYAREKPGKRPADTGGLLLSAFLAEHVLRAADGPACVNIFADFGINSFYKSRVDLDNELKDIHEYLCQALDEAADTPHHFRKLAQLARDFNDALKKSGRHEPVISPAALPDAGNRNSDAGSLVRKPFRPDKRLKNTSQDAFCRGSGKGRKARAWTPNDRRMKGASEL